MSKFTEEDDALLGELGVEVEVKKKATLTAKEERIIAGFEEIQRFVEEHGRKPQHGHENDIFERMYAVRLDRLSELEECRELLMEMDHQKILGSGEKEDLPGEDMDDDELLSALGVEPKEGSLQDLKHVRPSEERRSAEEIAQGQLCEDFDEYKSLFETVQSELQAGIRKTVRFGKDVQIKQGDFYIVGGIKAYIAEIGDKFVQDYGREDSRLRVIYDNGKESNPYLRSFQKSLWKDDAGRKIISPDLGPLFSDSKSEDDQATGTIYVLRSQCQDPEILKNREIIHKIGFTKGDVERRIADASNQPTYLLSDVEVVATYELYNLDAGKLENIIHRIFSGAKLDIELKDRFGKPYRPREWFLVPLSVIKEAIECIRDGTISDFVYDPQKGRLVEIG
ncbi:MAG: GIY-YIG nuclease family protein [Opitutae bacterium]|nr:GIY-YIG nuclease family protein [Opitutae bacterium]